MRIKRVWIESGCVMCQSSVDCCPEVFELDLENDTTRVKPELTDFSPYEAAIREAAAGCPPQVIHFEEE